MKLTPEQKTFGRRNFLKLSTTLPPVLFTKENAEARTEPIKIGIIGTGIEGRVLMSVLNRRLLELIAIADIRPDNRQKGVELANSMHGPVQEFVNYHDMLNLDELEAVIIATPLKLHGLMAIDSLNAGKHVFVEKSMAYTLDECRQMISLAEQKNLHLQVGYQRFYNPLYWQAADMVHAGQIGEVYHIRCAWHRNSNWDYRIYLENEMPEMQVFEPQQWGYQDLLHLVNWRWFEELSLGLWTELASHQLSASSWFLGNDKEDATPKEICAMGGTYHHQDEREVEDHIYAMLEYPGGKTVTYSSILTNGFDRYYELIQGTKGTILLTAENESYLFWEPGWDPEEEKEPKETQITIDNETSDGSAFAAQDTVSATKGKALGLMPKTDPYRFELEGFARTIRNGDSCYSSGARGLHTAKICHAARNSLKNRMRINL